LARSVEVFQSLMTEFDVAESTVEDYITAAYRDSGATREELEASLSTTICKDTKRGSFVKQNKFLKQLNL